MILHGLIDDKNQLWVTITVAGNQKQTEARAILDTGFTGEILLPLSIASTLDLIPAGVGKCELADGSISKQKIFVASINWGTQTRLVTVSVMDNIKDVLIGGGLLHGYVLTVDFKQKQLIIKEPGTDDPQIVVVAKQIRKKKIKRR